MPYAEHARNLACDLSYRATPARRASWRAWWARVNPRRRLRLQLHRRDRWRCHYCGKRGTMKTLTKDHKRPRARSGHDGLNNLVSACRSCNQRKGTMSYDSFRERMLAERGLPPSWLTEDFQEETA